MIMYSDELYSLLYRISYKKRNEYSNILGRNRCTFYVKKSVIQKVSSKKYVLLWWAEHLYCLTQLLKTQDSWMRSNPLVHLELLLYSVVVDCTPNWDCPLDNAACENQMRKYIWITGKSKVFLLILVFFTTGKI